MLLVQQMQRKKNILSNEPLQLQDAALLLLTALIFSAFFQFSNEFHHSFLPKEEKERTEKLEKEEIREKSGATFSENSGNGGDTNDNPAFLSKSHLSDKILFSYTTVKSLDFTLFFRIKKSRLFLQFQQIVFYD